MQILLVHNPFEFTKPKTWLAWIIRIVTNSEWNHCAVCIEIDGEQWVSDFQAHYKLRPYDEWLNEDKRRVFKTVYVESKVPLLQQKNEVIAGSGRYKGYDWIKLVNHLTKRKFGFVIFKENENRFICSEWVLFLQTGEKVNWAVPNDFV